VCYVCCSVSLSLLLGLVMGAVLYVIVARCPGSGARWFSLIVLLPAPVDRLSSCVDLLVV
jgi:hypothetical protein